VPTYDYFCSSCEKVWEAFHTIANRKTPEDIPCPHCMCDTVKQTIVHTNLSVSHVSETSRAFKKLNNSKFSEKMNQIHQSTPGSQMDKTSSIVHVK